MSMKEGTKIENRVVSEAIANGKITFTMQQRVVITDMLDLWCDGESFLTLPVKTFDESVKTDFAGDRQAAIQSLCNKSSGWVPQWYVFNRGIAGGLPISYGTKP